MGLREQIASDVNLVLFNTAELAEEVTYYKGYEKTESTITVVPEIGEDNARGNTFTNEGNAARAYFWIKASDVAWPEAPDEILYKGIYWQVARIWKSAGAFHQVQCIGRESGL